MSYYLYGASVQGIQSFIFQTNKLKDIVGASAMVDLICTEWFDPFAQDGVSIQRAAGNVKHLYYSEEACRKAVREFPKRVMTGAPGITISQAVVRYEDENGYEDAALKLEQRLREQRNRPAASLTLGLMGIERSRTTGLPAAEIQDDEWLDYATCENQSYGTKNVSLCQRAFGVNNVNASVVPFDIEAITQ